jgi:hypothetical protein
MCKIADYRISGNGYCTNGGYYETGKIRTKN